MRATVYQKKGKALVAIASWAKAATSVRLALDWKELDMDKHKVSMEAPRIEGMQDARSFAPGQPIAIQPGKGCLIFDRTGIGRIRNRSRRRTGCGIRRSTRELYGAGGRMQHVESVSFEKPTYPA